MSNIQLSGQTAKPKSGRKAKNLVILLHGLGADSSDLFSLIPQLSSSLEDTEFVALDAPFPCDMAPVGLQWFSLQIRSEEAILQGLEKVTPALNSYIDSKIKELGIKDEDVALLGFSQGSMLAMHTSLRRPKALAGVLAYSGALVAPEQLGQEIQSKPRICLIHGEDDMVVPFDAFKQANSTLNQLQVPVYAYSRSGLGHGIDPAGMQIGLKFLEESFTEPHKATA